MKAEKPQIIPGLLPWVCTVWKDNGKPYGIIIYGSSSEQIEADHPGVRVDGILLKTYHWNTDDKIIRATAKKLEGTKI